MIKNVCLGDIATISLNQSVIQGEVTFISKRGINISNQQDTHFYKWTHVQKVESELSNKLKKYEEALKFYADGEHYDGTYLGSYQYEYDYVETGETAREALK